MHEMGVYIENFMRTSSASLVCSNNDCQGEGFINFIPWFQNIFAYYVSIFAIEFNSFQTQSMKSYLCYVNFSKLWFFFSN